jgi:hypothetical protein
VSGIAKHLAALIAAGVVAVAAAAAGAFEVTQKISGGNQTACLDVAGGATAIGTPIIAYPCNDGFNEQWSVDQEGHFQGIGTANGVERCLDLNPVATTRVELNSCLNTWEVSKGLIFVGSMDLCIDSRGIYGATARVRADTCEEGLAGEIWVLHGVVIEQTIPNTDQSACVDVRGSAIADHTPVDAFLCGLGGNERWTYVDGQLQGVSSKGNTTCLGATAANRVELQTCNSGAAQSWSIGTGGVINSRALLCLDSRGKYGTTQLVLNRCKITPSQTWVLR